MKEQIEAVQAMLEYIDAHLEEPLSLTKLANVSHFSPWYARRLFVEYTGLTPAEYVRKVRLQKSVFRLRDEQVRILDVALECGFSSVDGYQRAFFKEFGCNPKEYAKHPVPLQLFLPYGIKMEYRERKRVDMNTAIIFTQEVKKPARLALIKRGEKATEYFSYCEEVGSDIWGILLSMKSLDGEPVCMWLPKEMMKPGTSEYVQGVEVPEDYIGEVPEGFDRISLPEATFLKFQGPPFMEENFEQAIYDVRKAIDQFDPTTIGYTWDSTNPRIQLEPIGKRGYIELVAVK